MQKISGASVVCVGPQISIFGPTQIAEAPDMVRLTQTKRDLLYGAAPYPPTGMVSIWPDVSKLKRELHWEPKVSFEEGIQAILRAITEESNP